MSHRNSIIKKVLSKFKRRSKRDFTAVVPADAAPPVTVPDPAKLPAVAAASASSELITDLSPSVEQEEGDIITGGESDGVEPATPAADSGNEPVKIEYQLRADMDDDADSHADSIVLEQTEAGLQAIRIPEILTQILSYVPPVVLLTRFRLVSKTWKREIEFGPLLKWITWVPIRGCTVRRLREHSSSVDITLPPPSIRQSYRNRNCSCDLSGPKTLYDSAGSALPNDADHGGEFNSPGCNEHCYTDTFSIHPIALHFLALFWKRFMRVPLATHERIVKTGTRDDLMDQLVALLKPKLRQFENATQDEPAPGVRVTTSNRLLRPETLAYSVVLYCGIQNECMIETKMYDNGATAPSHCDSSRSSSRKMLAVKDLVYNVMHRSFYGDEDILDVKRKRTQKARHRPKPDDNETEKTETEKTETDKTETEKTKAEKTESVGNSDVNKPENEEQPTPEPTPDPKDEEEDDTLPKYYSIIIHILAKSLNLYTRDGPKRGGMEDTEVEITLSLEEPFNVVDVSTRRLSQSFNNAAARSIPRYGGWDESDSSDMQKKRDWRTWARLTRPQRGHIFPTHAEMLRELATLGEKPPEE